MKTTYTIEDVYATPARAKVLRALALGSGSMSVRWVAACAGISHTAAGTVLRDLESMRMVIRRPVGRAHAYALDPANVYVREMVIPAVEAETGIIEELRNDLIADFAEHSQSLVLFGSYAWGGQEEDSDIDVFALAVDSRRRQLLEEKSLKKWDWYAAKYASPLSLMVYSRADASRGLGWGQSGFRTELASTGIILHGLGVDEWGLDGDGHAVQGRSPKPGETLLGEG